uniref:Cytochrome P450, family 46, subfamily A, polypeptide 1, tandem duplicate 4 n=1 Tax=Amphiprion ocellaris TaxID=80972 RepID=A0AAQ5X240_AMPOC
MAVSGLLLSWASQALLFLLLMLFIAFLGYCAYIKYTHLKYDHIPGPPRDSFILGHAPTFLKYMKEEKIVHDKFLEWAETYGTVYRINFLHTIIVCTTCPDTTKEVLMSPKYPKDKFLHNRLFNLFGQRFLGNGLVTARDHDQWYKQRRIMDPAFSSLYLRGLMGTFNETAEKLMDKLTEFADSQTETNMLGLVNCVTLDVITKVAFGVDLDFLAKSSPLPKAIEACLKGMVYNVRDIFFEYVPKNWPFVKEVRDACRLLRTTGAQWIHERKTAINNGDEVPKDILTSQYMRKEVDDVVGMKQDVSYDDLGKLIYLSQVLKETLRMYPTAPGTSREIAKDMVIDGIHIPGGFNCIFSSYVTSRMNKFFKDPLTFDPDRFHPDAPKPYYCYYPFSLGPRSCLGQNFAQMEAKVVMAKLVQRFDFSLVPGQTFDIRDTGTLRPKSGVVCTVRHRKYKN